MKNSLSLLHSAIEQNSLQNSLPKGLVYLFAVASGLSVANVYYAQPLLNSLSRDFHISDAAIGGVITATQVGSILALLLLVPLGDKMKRRHLMGWQLSALVLSLLIVAIAKTPAMLLIGMLAVGMLGTAMTQGLISYAASSAGTHEQGHVIGTAQGGVFIGLLLARVFSGAISDLTSWRGVYLSSALLMLAIAYPLWRYLPQIDPPKNAMNYSTLLRSMATLFKRQKVLQVRGFLALLMFAAFNIFWSALVIPLSDAPHYFSHTQIGALGLVGVVGALIASRTGRLADYGYGQIVSFIALLLLTLSWLPIAFMDSSLWALIIGIILLDVGGQSLHVTNQSMIYCSEPEAHSRLVGLYMMFYAVGSGLGAVSSTWIYAHAGWNGVCLLGVGVSAFALIFWWLTRHIR
ncbi:MULTISPECIES: MFS transporter [unclassified Providencia]|uniref:MFS transporter n=1 Tax=unclassified Providencia TaxID=2633465 RepID=UPI0012B57B43|nr:MULTISPECIES: MFS transporter [unclassified Providencia]MTC42224.1 MFS transporter [Providencia sp. wls1921]MTC46125.1 MFS transporter [Providencia sp. wls1922]